MTRVGPDEFLVVSSSATTVRDLDWLGRQAFERVGAAVEIEDVTERHSVIGVMGPLARDLLAPLTEADLSEEGFAFATSRAITLGGAPVRATRMTYVGELGWELMVPVDHALSVYDAVRAAGEPLGAVDAGYYAIESLRLEKGYRAFGRELTPDYTPVEAGLVFATALTGDKDFLGRAALSAHRESLADRRSAPPTGVARPRGPHTDAVGRRAGPARRLPGGSGDQRRVGRDWSVPASASPTCATTARSRRTGWQQGTSRST